MISVTKPESDVLSVYHGNTDTKAAADKKFFSSSLNPHKTFVQEPALKQNSPEKFIHPETHVLFQQPHVTGRE